MSYKNCLNCANRRGSINTGMCVLSGHYVTIERKYPTVCGVDFRRWQPRMGVLLRIKHWFTGTPALPDTAGEKP